MNVDYSDKLQELNALRNSYTVSLNERKERKDEIERQLSVLIKSQEFVQEIAKKVQSQLSSSIDSIVNLGLSSVFPDYDFEMEYVSNRGKTEVQFNLKNKDTVIDPMFQCGGGLVDVLCFCLRIAVYSISNVNNCIILDEPFRFISKNLRNNIAELLHVISEKLNIQIIEVTHITEFSENSDNKIFIKKIDGISEVIDECN